MRNTRKIQKRFCIAAVFSLVSISMVQAAEPRLKMRTPDDKMLQKPDQAIREVRAPMALDETELRPEAKNLFSELPLAGRRGQETPRGTKSGRYCENGFLRAGCPNWLGRFAKPSTDAYHQVSYVGGGTLFGGSSRRTDEGTFGMDYSGYWFARKTWLKWSHGERHQGGAGRYETDGPHLLPE